MGQKKAPKALPENTHRDAAAPVESKTICREIVPGGWYWTTRLDRGDALRLINVTGGSCISGLAWNAYDRSERLNHADTIKVQWAANLQKGRVILSDMGRVLFSIVEDTSGKHDAVVGGSSPESNRTRYGARRHRNTRDNFISAAAKLGLDRRDVHPCVSFFVPVGVGADGQFKWNDGVRQAGDFVDLRAEMDLLVALSNCPHPMDPSSAYAPGDVEIVRFRSEPAKSDDLCGRQVRKTSGRSRTTLWPARAHKELTMVYNAIPGSAHIVLDTAIEACAPWSARIRKGQSLRIIDSHGQQAVDTLFYNAVDPAERYSGQDTIRAQGSLYIGKGTALMSNEGRVMLHVTADTCGLHDTCAGACSCESNTVRFGHQTNYSHACRENFLTEGAKYGLSKRDIVPNLNFFMNVPIDPDGKCTVVDGVSKPGDYVEMLAEMDVLCLISNCPQIHNPCNGFFPTPIRAVVFEERDGTPQTGVVTKRE